MNKVRDLNQKRVRISSPIKLDINEIKVKELSPSYQQLLGNAKPYDLAIPDSDNEDGELGDDVVADLPAAT